MTVYSIKIADIPKDELKQWEHYLIMYDQITTNESNEEVEQRICRWLYDSNKLQYIELDTSNTPYYSLCRTSLISNSKPLTLEVLAQETLLLLVGN